MTEQRKSNHKHHWIIPEGAESNDILICEKCGIDYDKWVEKMEAKGYTIQQLRRFEEE